MNTWESPLYTKFISSAPLIGIPKNQIVEIAAQTTLDREHMEISGDAEVDQIIKKELAMRLAEIIIAEDIIQISTAAVDPFTTKFEARLKIIQE